MALRNVRDFVNAEVDGQTWLTTWRKTPTQTTTNGIWFDLSTSPGNPVPNYYAATPNVATALKQSIDGGIYHGGAVKQLGFKKYVKSFLALASSTSSVPLPLILCDYLLFYPFVDMSLTDAQAMTNTVTLPRATTGKGVQIMAVVVAAQSGSGNPKFVVNYTNSLGVSNRQTPSVATNSQAVAGTIITTERALNSSAGPFLPLQAGDVGVRTIDSVTFLTADIGRLAFVLVLPIENHIIRAADAPAERVPFSDFSYLPTIEDDAYLNFLCCSNNNISGPALHGILQVVWA